MKDRLRLDFGIHLTLAFGKCIEGRKFSSVLVSVIYIQFDLPTESTWDW
jgi:hypothetical protein